jgi:glucose-1-phosphate cytidylyltransferase
VERRTIAPRSRPVYGADFPRLRVPSYAPVALCATRRPHTQHSAGSRLSNQLDSPVDAKYVGLPSREYMQVMILCGGMGTRLREETEYRPKPMVEIGGRPIVWHIMKHFSQYGMRQFVLCLGYKATVIKDYFLRYEESNNDFTISLGRERKVTYHQAHEEQEFEVTLADTGLHTMTGGRVKRASRYLKDTPFIVTYGDGLANVDINALVRFHKSHGKLATVTTVSPQSRFGILDLDQNGVVRSFAEKPKVDGWANAGFLVFERQVLDYISEDASCILEREPLERLAKDGQLVAYRHEGFFQAMDTYREYQMLNEQWDQGKALWKTWT